MNVESGNEATQFFFGNICFDFTGQCISNAASSIENFGSCIREKGTNTCYSVIQLIGKWKTQEALVKYPRSLGYDTQHCTAIYSENSKQIFPAMKLSSLVPNFYIPVSVSD
jgi:hypothetical protein